jgi:hypothetical protein
MSLLPVDRTEGWLAVCSINFLASIVEVGSSFGYVGFLKGNAAF